jgi:hypothetical protein
VGQALSPNEEHSIGGARPRRKSAEWERPGAGTADRMLFINGNFPGPNQSGQSTRLWPSSWGSLIPRYIISPHPIRPLQKVELLEQQRQGEERGMGR